MKSMSGDRRGTRAVRSRRCRSTNRTAIVAGDRVSRRTSRVRRNKILDGVSFTVRRGETKLILGRSGGGKSTTIRLILGLLKPDSGQILIDGEDITDYTEEEMMPVRQEDRDGLSGRGSCSIRFRSMRTSLTGFTNRACR